MYACMYVYVSDFSVSVYMTPSQRDNIYVRSVTQVVWTSNCRRAADITDYVIVSQTKRKGPTTERRVFPSMYVSHWCITSLLQP